MLKNRRPYTDENGWVDDSLIDDLPKDDSHKLMKWLQEHIVESDKINTSTSYGLKHRFEGITGVYVTNNTFKDGMWQLGFKPVNVNELNWRYKIIVKLPYNKVLPEYIYKEKHFKNGKSSVEYKNKVRIGKRSLTLKGRLIWNNGRMRIKSISSYNNVYFADSYEEARDCLSKILGIEHEVVAIADIDKYALASYEAIHGYTKNLGDISKIEIDDIPDHDLFTYSFPCQDISVAGKGLGLDEGGETRSGLLWECKKIIEHKKPKYLMLENVKNLVGKKHKHNFDKWLEWLEEQGYYNYWQVLNAKDYGIPQNRERVFVISVLGKDIDFKFPEKQELKLRLKDLLESEVDEKFYLSEKQEDKIRNSTFTLSKDYKAPKCVRIGGIFDSENKRHQAGSVWDKEQLSPTLDTMQGGWRQPSVLIAKEEMGRMGKQAIDTYNSNELKTGDTINPFNNKTSSTNGISPTVTTKPEGFKTAISLVENYRVRKLTPKECWRLMGFSDEDFEKAAQVNSNSQLYKQAGNSIVVNVLEGIFRELFKGE